MSEDKLLIQDEIVKYQEMYIEELEQEIALLKRTILKQKKDIQILLKQKVMTKKDFNCNKNKCNNNCSDHSCLNHLGYNPYQE